ncbi:hypothetical protein B0H11DRAFT_1926774 [Mycena galericulata]|nr:hypothetical protein B0H11DRAFT_1926774 [Mycena galericulata]
MPINHGQSSKSKHKKEHNKKPGYETSARVDLIRLQFPPALERRPSIMAKASAFKVQAQQRTQQKTRLQDKREGRSQKQAAIRSLKLTIIPCLSSRHCALPAPSPMRRLPDAAKQRRLMGHPCDGVLDFNTPITGMIWPQNDADPIQVMLYPREDYRVRLSDHKLILASVGFEQGAKGNKYPRRYCRDHGLGVWTAFTWDTPLRVFGRGDTILIRPEVSGHLKSFSVHSAHMDSGDIFPSQEPLVTHSSILRRADDYASDHLLDFSTAITVMIWLESNVEPVQTIVYPREDLRVRLSDHKETLQAVGFSDETGKVPQRWYREEGVGSWWTCAWDTPLKVCGAGDTILLSLDGVDDLKNFCMHEAHML